MGEFVENLTNGESTRTINLLAMITSALAVVVMAFGLWILSSIDSKVDRLNTKVDNNTVLFLQHAGGPPHAGVDRRLEKLEERVFDK